MAKNITQSPTNQTPINGLPNYIRDVQFRNWKENRKPLETKWEGNRKAFQAVYDPDKQWKTGEGSEWRSNTYIKFTKQKIMAAFSQISDFLLQKGRIPFDITPSKWDEMTLDTMEEVDKEFARTSMTQQQDLIDHQLFETKSDREAMKNMMAGAIYGVTYAKTPVEEVLRKGYRKVGVPGVEDETNIQEDDRAWEPYSEIHTTRSWKYVSTWNIFRDLETDDLKECEGVIHREMVSPYWLRQQMGEPYWIEAGIEDAIRITDTKGQTGVGGTQSISAEKDGLPPILRDLQYRYNTLEYIEYWGRVPRQMAEDFEKWLAEYYEQVRIANETGELIVMPASIFQMAEDENMDGDEVEVMIAMAEDYPVRYVRTTKEQRPFYSAIWDQNVDELADQGVADNVEDMQHVINGAFRAIEDNKKLSGNLALAVKSRIVENMPADLTPGMRVEVSDEVDDVRQAIQPIIFPDVGSSLIDLLQIAFQIGDEDSQIPKIQQGFQESGTQTAFQIAQQLSKAGKYLGQVIRNFDEGLIEPIITSFYDYNMINPEVNIGKGNFVVEAQGFQSFQNRSQELATLNQLLTMALSHPSLEQMTKIRDIWADIIRALDLSTDDYMRNVQEMEILQSNQQPDPTQVAELEKTQSETEKNKATAAKALSDADVNQEEVKLKRVNTISDVESKNREAAKTIPGLGEPGMQLNRTPTQNTNAPQSV